MLVEVTASIFWCFGRSCGNIVVMILMLIKVMASILS